MARHTHTGSATTDSVCCVHARAFVLVGSAFDTLDTMMLTFVLVISTAVHAELARSTASSPACPR